MNAKEGEAAVKLARRAIDSWVARGVRIKPEGLPPVFDEERGVFVTINTHPGHELRGCIGFVEAAFPLGEGIVEAAIFATRDPRFPELKKEELDRVVVEVSVLTKPKLLEGERKKLPERIVIGRDGLIVRRGFSNGLLLPQVAVEHGMDAESFLAHTCLKAGLEPGAWRDKDTQVYCFSAEVFAEREPRGEVYKKDNVKC